MAVPKSLSDRRGRRGPTESPPTVLPDSTRIEPTKLPTEALEDAGFGVPPDCPTERSVARADAEPEST